MLLFYSRVSGVGQPPFTLNCGPQPGSGGLASENDFMNQRDVLTRSPIFFLACL